MSTNPAPARSRRPSGTPTGGQFAPEAHAEPEVTLGPQPPEPSVEPESTPTTDKYGTTRWRNSAGGLHRTDGPAVEYADGPKEWYVNGQRHRTDGPAIEWTDGRKDWYRNGQRHRTDGPAIEYADGRKDWYRNGHLHRTDGPAIEWANGDRGWYVNGQPHRIDGPAIEYASGSRQWWVNGSHLSADEFRTTHERAFARAFSPQVVMAFLAASGHSGPHPDEDKIRAAAEQFLASSDSDELRSAYQAAVDRILYRAETGITGPLPTTPEAAKRARDLGK